MKKVISHHIGLRVTADEHAKYMAQGGAKWFREKLAEASSETRTSCVTCVMVDPRDLECMSVLKCENFNKWKAK